MSNFLGHPQNVTCNSPEDKRIFFKGLEKCLEAFTSGEGRVVRKYARLFSQLSGKRQEDDEEAISWSSSDEDDREAVSHNTIVSRRSKVTRKLNSRINFDSRINAKKNGRRLTSAEFSRSVNHVSQDPLAIYSENSSIEKASTQISLPDPESSTSLLKASTDIPIDEEHGNSKVEDDSPPPPLIPGRDNFTFDNDITSPIFKLNSSKNKGKRHRFKCKVFNETENNSNSDEGSKDKVKEVLSLPDPLPTVNVNICLSPQESSQLTPKSKASEENYGVMSPVLGLKGVKSPFLSFKTDPSLSPVMRKPKRRKRQLNHTVPLPASPILETKKKKSTFKRKRRILTTASKASSPNRDNESNTSALGVVPSSSSYTHPVGSDTSKCTVKRSLDFAIENETNVGSGFYAKSLTKRSQHALTEETAADHLSSKNSGENRLNPTLRKLGELPNIPENDPSENTLNATNYIEEVNTEELNFSVLPQADRHRPNRLLLKTRFSKRKRAAILSPSPETIEENSQTQCLSEPKMTEEYIFKTPVLSQRKKMRGLSPGTLETPIEEPQLSSFNFPKSEAVRQLSTKASKRCDEELGRASSEKDDFLNQTNLIEEVYTEELDLSAFKNPSRGIFAQNVFPAGLEEASEMGVDEDSQVIPSSQSSPEECHPKVTSKSVVEASEKMQTVFRTNRTTRSRDPELIISQSSTRSDPLKSSQTSSAVIESVSSPASRGNREISDPSTGTISRSNSTRSPVVSSPLVISSAGSSPDVKTVDLPFVILEDEYNAPPKRRNKKLDSNGIASRLQRLLNQRRSDARIWQFKHSKLSRLSNRNEEKNPTESQGRVLHVFSVRTDYSHIVLYSKEDKGKHSTVRKEFRNTVLVVLDPGVVVRLLKVMNATKIKIFPPWQSVDLLDYDITVVLGANTVEVLSTERDTHTLQDNCEKLTHVKKYACPCFSPVPAGTIMLDCWDGVQSLGLFDIMFPLSTSSSAQLVQFNDNSLQSLENPDSNNIKRDQIKYSIKALLSAQSTTSHGKGVLVLTVLRVLCYRQRSFGFSSKTDTSLHWSIVGRDDSNEVCELLLGQIQMTDTEKRCDCSDFVSGTSLGRRYKFRGVAVSQRLDRSRFCGEWNIVPNEQKIIYVLVPSHEFFFSNEDSTSEPALWKPQISTLALHVCDETNDNSPSKLSRVSFVCRIFHANEHALYVADQSISPQLFFIELKPSIFIPPVIYAAVQKPSPTRMLIYLQDLEASKGRLVGDKYSRVIVLDDKGCAYPEDRYRKTWPASSEVCSVLLRIKCLLPQFSPRSRTHNIVKLSGVVFNLDETSALMWPACGSCGNPVNTEDKNVNYCAQCSKVCKDLVVHMSLVVFVKCADFSKDVSIRVKILHKTVQALLRTIPKEGQVRAAHGQSNLATEKTGTEIRMLVLLLCFQDIRVREALGKPIGPIRCEVMASHGGSFVLNELPSSLWM